MALARLLMALVIGMAVGGAVYGGVIALGSLIIPPPAGMNPTDWDSVAAAVHLLETRHYVVRFLAHASCSLVGGMLAYIVGGRYRSMAVYAIGLFFLSMGIMAAQMIPAPMGFVVFDLVAAYIPMAVLGGSIGRSMSGEKRKKK